MITNASSTTTAATADVQGYVDIDGVRTYHEVSGAGDPLVLLHGGMCTVETFAALAAELAPSYRVHRPERRGHGRTADQPGPLTYEVMAADTVAYVEALDLAPAHLVGWSDGAVVALLVALTRPDLARSLVFIGSPLTADGMPPEMLPLPEVVPIEALPPFLREMYAAVSPDGADHFDVVWQKLAPAWTRFPYVELEELAHLRVPTLVALGDRDMVTVADADDIRRRIPDARLAVLPGEHALPMHSPALVAGVVRDFLAPG